MFHLIWKLTFAPRVSLFVLSIIVLNHNAMTPSRSSITKKTIKARNQAIWFHINNVRLNVSTLFSFSTHLAFATNQRYFSNFWLQSKSKIKLSQTNGFENSESCFDKHSGSACWMMMQDCAGLEFCGEICEIKHSF